MSTNMYPKDHPIWQDIHFCPEWLYQHIQDPEAAQQKLQQQAELTFGTGSWQPGQTFALQQQILPQSQHYQQQRPR